MASTWRGAGHRLPMGRRAEPGAAGEETGHRSARKRTGRRVISGLTVSLGLLLGAAGVADQAGTAGAGQSGEATPGTPTVAGAATTFALPGEEVFPEGVTCDPASGNFFVGSTADGTIYRGNVRSSAGAAAVFLPGGADGREAVTGLKLDGRGRLFAAGRRTGRAFVYDATSGDLIKAFETPQAESTLINDVAVTTDAAYFTDSFRPILFRVPLTEDEVGEMEPWLDLRGTAIAYGSGFNLNGIAATPDGRFLLTVHYDAGELYRIDTEDKTVTRVDLGGETLPTADGILLDGQTLYVVLGGPEEIVPVSLSEDLARGEVGDGFADPSFRDPTTIAASGDGRLLVVNSQLAMEGGGGAPELPFTVSIIPIP